MSCVLMSGKCHSCEKEYPEIWVERDLKGNPSFEGLVCTNCKSKNCIRRNWSEQKINSIIPLPEDGQVHRFEYEYRNEDGKKIQKKVDPSLVKKHLELANKGIIK